MKTFPILRRSIAALLFALPASQAAPDTLSGSSPAWASGGNWSLGSPPGIGDHAVLAATGIVNVDGAVLGGSTELQDMTFSSIGLALTNDGAASPMDLILNGGRGAGVPLIQTLGDAAYAIQSGATSPLRLVLNASGDISVGSSDTSLALTIGSDIAESGGARSLRKIGAGRLILGGSNSFSGGVTVAAGALEATSNGALGTGAVAIDGGTLEINQAVTTLAASSLTVNAGGQLALNNGSVLANAVTLAGGTLTARTVSGGNFNGAVSVTASSTVDLRSYTDPATSLDLTIGGQLTGSSALNLTGNTPGGTLTLTNTTTNFSGTYNVGAGQTLRNMPAANGKTIGTGAIHLTGGALQVRDNASALNYGNAITVGAGGGSIHVDRVSGASSPRTVAFGTLSIGAETVSFTAGNNYRASFTTTTMTGAATFDLGSGGSAPAQVFMNGAIGGAFDLTKSGIGTLRLQAANTYSGQTHINGGTLLLSGAGAIASSPRINLAAGASLDVNGVTGGFKLGATQTLAGAGTVSGAFTTLSGATIEPGGPAGTGTLTMSALTLGQVAGDATTVNFATVLNAAKLNVTGANGLVANGGASSVTINIGGAAPPLGAYTLLDYSGTLGGTGAAAFALGTLPTRLVGATLVNNAGNTSLDLNVTAIDFPIWTGALNSEWTTTAQAAPKNWVLNSNNSTSTDFLADDNVAFTDLATQTSVNIGTTDVAAGAVVFDNTANDYTITGTRAIVGFGGLTKNGTSRATILNTNSFVGPVTVNAGTLSVATIADSGVDSSLGAGSSLALAGGNFEYTGPDASTNRAVSVGASGATFNITNALTLAGTITVAGPLTIDTGTLRLSPTGNLTLGDVSGTGALSFAGGATITLGGASPNTYTGVTEISGATVIAGKPAGTDAIPGDLIINAGGVFRYLNNNVSNQIPDFSSIVINGGNFGDPFTAGPTDPGATDTVTNITVNGGYFASGRNVIPGPFTITGTLHVLGGGVALAQRAGIISATTVQIDGGSVNLDGGSTTANAQSRLDAGFGGLTLASGTINFNAGPSLLTGASQGSILRLSGDVISSGTSQFVNLNPGVLNAVVDLLGTRIFDVADTLDIGSLFAPITITNGSIIKTGTGTLTISGTQTYFSLIADGGVTTLNTPLGTGFSTVTANATVVFQSDQALALLDIGPTGVVRVADAAPAPGVGEVFVASDAGIAAVPEPGSWTLLCLGAAAFLRRRRLPTPARARSG